MTTRRPSVDINFQQDIMRCVADEDGNLVFVSPALCRTVGISQAALAGKPIGTILSVIDRLDKTLSAPNDNNNHNDENDGFFETALYRQSRDPLLLQARIDRVRLQEGKNYIVYWLDPDGQLAKANSEGLNIAAAEFTAFALRSNKASPHTGAMPISRDDGELSHFLNLTNDLIGVYTQEGSFVRVNTAFSRVLGFSDAELRLFPFIDLIHSEDRSYVQRLMRQVMEAPSDREVRIDFECRTRCKDGAFRWVQWLQKAAGGHIYIVGQDVTNIKKHEAELHHREQQLSEAQKIGRMGHWYWVVEKDAMEWSDQIYSIFGVTREDFIPSLDSINSRLIKHDLGRIYKAFRRALITRQDYEIQFRLRRPNGGVRYIHCEGRCKIDPRSGKVDVLYGIMQDITERTLHERALQEAKEAAESAYASKTRFLANMSHELRTPLNAIIGFSEMMQRQLLGPLGNERYLDYIGGIRESGEHLLNLINDILDMSKIEIGKYELFPEEINVGKLIRLALHMMEGRAQESGVRLIAEHIPEDIQINADRRAMMQILLNLLSNAIKFTPSGGSVEVILNKELAGVSIEVNDTGVGIPRDKLNVVTLPFEQVGSELTRRHEGSGLGLAITKELISMHGGTLDLESEIGHGTTVTIMLPEQIPTRKNDQLDA